MSDHAEQPPAEGRDGTRRRPPYAAALLAATFVCAAFAATGSGTVFVFGLLRGFPEGNAFAARVAVKAVLFLVVAASSAEGLRRTIRRRPEEPPGPLSTAPETPAARIAFWVVLVLTAAAVLPNLTQYPWFAPDESHHFIVARNLAEYGLYASGHPDSGFVPFDAYDSVGAPVMVSVATAFRVLGVSLVTARLVMATYFLFLLLVVYFLTKPVFGVGGGVCCALMMPFTGSAIYLARTLYGEAPALFFLLLGLLLWRRALEDDALGQIGFWAGVCFAVAVLSKTLLLVSAFAFLGALLFDALTHRRIKPRHVAIPAIGFASVFAAWWAYQAWVQRGAPPAAARHTLALYQHLLLFGLTSVGRTTRALFDEPGLLAALLAGLAAGVPVVFRRRYDPPCVVLFLTSVLYLFWWYFFTPGQLPRYTYFAFAAGGIFTGGLLWRALEGLFARTGRWRTRLAWAIVLCVAGAPGLMHASQQMGLAWTLDEMAGDRALVAFVQDLPPKLRVATTWYPASRLLNALAHRHVPVVAHRSESPPGYAMVVVDGASQRDQLDGAHVLATLGRYTIVSARE